MGVLELSFKVAINIVESSHVLEPDAFLPQGFREFCAGPVAVVGDPLDEGSPVLGEPYIVLGVVQRGVKVEDIDDAHLILR